MVKKIRVGGVSKVVNQIPKFPPRPTQRDFPEPTASDNFHKNLIRVDGEMPFEKPKGIVSNGSVTATNIPTQHRRASILKKAQGFSAPQHAGLIRVN